jgi:DNA mismatch endonuclease (patch repair protein)
MDNLTVEQRHKNMSHIRSTDTKIEVVLRKTLWHKGIRYRKNYKKLPGKPDIAITKYKIAIFCDSEFWHGQNWEQRQKQIKSNREYWINKINSNIKRDEEVNKKLSALGWTVLRFWGNEILKHTNECVKTIEESILDNIIKNALYDA